jgi:hypothetical protein
VLEERKGLASQCNHSLEIGDNPGSNPGRGVNPSCDLKAIHIYQLTFFKSYEKLTEMTKNLRKDTIFNNQIFFIKNNHNFLSKDLILTSNSGFT